MKIDLRQHALNITLAAAGIVCVLLLPRLLPQPSAAIPDKGMARVVKGELDISVNMIGELDAARTHIVCSTLKGDKGKIIFLVEEGRNVQKDDVLVRLDPSPFETEVHRLGGELRSLKAAEEAARLMLELDRNQTEREIRTAEFDRQVAELDLQRLVDGEGPLQLAQYKSELEKAKEDHDRLGAYIADLERLSRRGVDSSGELEMARRKAAQLTEIYKSARQRYNSYKNHVLPTAIASARVRARKAVAEIDQAKKAAVYKVGRSTAGLSEIQGKRETTQAALQQALADLDKTTISAPFDGIAIHYEMFRDGQKRKPRVGDLVWQNQPLLYLPEIETMVVKTRIREVDLHKIATGQTCAIQVDAFPRQHYTGQVAQVGALATERFGKGGSEKFFQLTIAVDGVNTDLRPGMTARVSVSGAHTGNIVLVPIHAIFREGAESYCYLALDDGQFIKAAIKTGRYNEDQVEVVRGLRPGDAVSVVQPDPDQIAATPSLPQE